MVRKLDARADALRDLGAKVVVADMLDIVAVRAAIACAQARSAGSVWRGDRLRGIGKARACFARSHCPDLSL